MKIAGGITCCQTFSSLTLSDTQVGSYGTPLWSNPILNITVYNTPTLGVGTNINWNINNVVNPNQVMYATYQNIMTTTFIMYNNYQTRYITKLNQPDFSTYTLDTDFTVGSNPSLIIGNANYGFHQYFPMIYEFSLNPNSNSYTGRNISYIIIYFTSGVRLVEDAWFRYYPSPYFTNPNGKPVVGYDTVAGQWFVNITGFQDSYFSSTYNWYVRVRLYANGNSNYFYYTSTVYNFNGNQEFTTTSGSKYLINDNWSSSSNWGTPTTFAP